mmetsp:Transcript_11587/g.23552  ORF Transcript_11587/g.23552 Transcript_11587/m.23552 type:complete len:133 (+) Transcript_11587:55-453(+)
MAFVVSGGAVGVTRTTKTKVSSVRLVAVPSRGDRTGRARHVVQMAAEGQSWEGDWVCVDCGYIYERSNATKFEALGEAWRCPQCKAPKRRFAKKAGDFVQETADTTNAPIVAASLVGLAALVLFSVWAIKSL